VFFEYAQICSRLGFRLGISFGVIGLGISYSMQGVCQNASVSFFLRSICANASPRFCMRNVYKNAFKGLGLGSESLNLYF
jgi:hypothetical protein